jgi:hypothetical protein
MFWKNNGLSVVLIALFVASMVGQALTGWVDSNRDASAHGQPPTTLSNYLSSGHFWEATGENWESEFLQMAAFVLLTVFLRQKGSSESKRIDVVEPVDLDPRDHASDPEAPGPVRKGGFILRLYENSLGLTFALLFVMSVAIHAAGGLGEYNAEQEEHGQPQVTLGGYMSSSRFWFESFQNWQSEFLSLAAMVIGTIYLRQRASAESKPVFAAHSETGR